jgi:hypothetical protein|nr:MAG TPA: Keratin [Caudoviricetes sp.]
MKYNYILGLDEADMKKIRGFRLRLVNLFFPALVDVLRRTAETKAYYLLKYRDEIELNRSLEKEINELKWDINKLTAELNELKGARDERLRKARANHSMSINDYQVALRSEQEKNERLKKEVKALNKTISKLKEQSDNKSKDNEVEGSSEVSGNER